MKKIRYDLEEWHGGQWHVTTSFWALCDTRISLWPIDPTHFRLVRIETVDTLSTRVTDSPRSAEDIHD